VPKCLELARQCLALAEQSQDAGQLLVSHTMTGISLWFMGQLAEARKHLDIVCATDYDLATRSAVISRAGWDMLVSAYAYQGFVLWLQGYPDQAVEKVKIAVTHANSSNHPYTRACAYMYLTKMDMYRQDGAATQASAQMFLERAAKYEFVPLQGQVMLAWANAQCH
jgi:hypothetical protein